MAAEAILCQLVAEIVFKTIEIAKDIFLNGLTYLHDKHDFKVRLSIQTLRLRGFALLLSNPVISKHIKPSDRHTYFHVMQKLHTLLISYASKSSGCSERSLRENSAEELFRRLELEDPGLGEPTREQERYWLRTKEIVVWSVFKKRGLEKLVIGVEQWGDRLEKLTSATIPLIFIREQFSAEKIQRNLPGEELVDTNIKGRILIEKKGDEEAAMSMARNSGKLKVQYTGSTEMPYSRLKFLISPSDGSQGKGEERNERTDLGGKSRRQWAELYSNSGELLESRVIVEFKERPLLHAMTQDMEEIESVKRELRSLVKILRLASDQHSDTFKVLYCHGFYEQPEQYGLIYRLPPTIQIDEYMHCESLGNILMQETYNSLLGANLQNRLDLAKSLAATISHLHSVQWVHKSFNPDNILLFGRRIPPSTTTIPSPSLQFDWSHPYLVGFDASRANRAHSDKLPSNLRWENRVYTHPSKQRSLQTPRFEYKFDIYSLGVVLLEIGRLQCFKHDQYRKCSAWTNIPATEVQRKFVEMARELRGRVGRTYAEIVEVCLVAGFDVREDDADETKLLDAFRSDVCEKFDLIQY
jgi:hypothetical protein